MFIPKKLDEIDLVVTIASAIETAALGSMALTIAKGSKSEFKFRVAVEKIKLRIC
jgi:hypothetical protein